MEADPSRAPPSSPIPADDPRTYFAAERTHLAYIRTALALMGFGFVVARFGLFLREIASVRGSVPIPRTGLSLLIGTALVLIGVAVNVLAAIRQIQFTRSLPETSIPQPAWFGVVGIALALVLAVIGLAMAVYLIVVS